MNFLFHTIIFFDKQPVYYNIYSTVSGYFAEILENPMKVPGARNFELINRPHEKFDESQYEDQVELLWDEIESWQKRARNS